MKKLNLNHFVKVKFTDHGKDIYYHQYDSLIEAMKAKGVKPISPSYPPVDEDGYSTMQLWSFMNLYGPHITMGAPNVIEDLYIYIDERDLDEVDAPLEAVIPLQPTPREIEVMEKYYVVTKNDYPWGYKRIADRFGVNVDDLFRVNNLSWEKSLTPGQHLWIPKRKEI